MSELGIIGIILLIHAILLLITSIYAIKNWRRINPSHFLWMLLIPFFGPLTGFALIRASSKTPPDLDWLNQKEDFEKLNFSSYLSPEETIPLEEALLINDPKKRRLLMMNILRSDPMKYLDLLLVARFNEDSETAHYATATIMEIQRQFQLESQRMQQELADDPQNPSKHRDYIDLLSRYCDSGLLEGQLLYRQQLVLKKALEKAPEISEDPSILRIKIRNCLALKEAEEAKRTAQSLIRLNPLDESSWLEAIRVCVEIHDQDGMQQLLMRLKQTPVDFTAAGRQHLLFYVENLE